MIRQRYLNKIFNAGNTKAIKVIVGMRRAGKTEILKSLINEFREKLLIKEESIIYINFELIK
jgi:predicted AAA+ superfamily ATPase